MQIASEKIPLDVAERPREDRSWLATALALAVGISITLCVCGYQFGHSNHTIYLLSPLYQSDPHLLARDWFTTQTFQYHAAFGWLTRVLMAAHMLEGGFLAGYLVLVAAFHIAWLRLVILLGGSLRTYLVSVLMYYLSAGGTGLGMYQFFQDSAFLASNIASVVLFVAMILWIDRRGIASGICVGLAGIFHLNFALLGALLWLMWIGADAISSIRHRRRATFIPRRAILPIGDWRFWIATSAALLPCLGNIAYASILKFRTTAQPMPLNEFIDLYVRFRHPHHYDPRSWPIALWISFLWPIAPAIAAYLILSRSAAPVVRRNLLDAARIFVLFAILLMIALLGAGFWFVSETLVQMSLYRFSIYAQIFACMGAALLVCDCARVSRASMYVVMLGLGLIISLTPVLIWVGPREGWLAVHGIGAFINHKRGGLLLFAALSCAPAIHELFGTIRRRVLRGALQILAIAFLASVIALGWNRWIGLTNILQPADDQYLALCGWARRNTPTSAIFLVPPDESDFRYNAQRAIVVNFKAVPQLSSEFREWQRRLQDVLGVQNLRAALPRGFDKVGPAMADRYANLPADHLIDVAHRYHAGYIVTPRAYDDPGLRLVYKSGGRYLLYAVMR